MERYFPTPPTPCRASHSAFFRAKILCKIQKWVKDHHCHCLSAGIPFRPLDPFSTIDFIITKFRLARQDGDETYSKLFSNMKDMKNSWDRAVVQQKITTKYHNAAHLRTAYIPTSPSYPPGPSPTAPSGGPDLKIKKKVYCLYRSHTCKNRACVSS